MKKIVDRNFIFDKYYWLQHQFPADMQDKMLLCGGAAAYLFGSTDRPFSNDIDVMVPLDFKEYLADELHVKPSVNEDKPLFKSLAGHIRHDDLTYDIILESRLHLPSVASEPISIKINDQILQKKIIFNEGDGELFCIPAELLILIKLLAARDESLRKYDLHDVQAIIKQQAFFDVSFFQKLLADFLLTKQPAIDRLKQSATVINERYGSATLLELISCLKPL